LGASVPPGPYAYENIYSVCGGIGVLVHGHTGEKRIREEGNLSDFSPTLLKNYCVNFPKGDGVGVVGLRGRRKNFPFCVKIPCYFYIIILFSTTILHMPSF
jgi:hypothetical protein